MTTFALSSIGKTAVAGNASATGGAQPDAPSSGNASPFDLLLQSADGGAGPSNTTTGGPAAGATSTLATTADATASPAAGTAKPTDPATKSGGSASTQGKQASASGATGTTGQSLASSDGTNAAAASGQAGSAGGGSPVAMAADAHADSSAAIATSTGAASATAAADAPETDFDPQLLRDLTSALDELEQDEKAGVTPSKDLLKRLQQTVNALSGYLAALQPGAAPALADTPAQAASNGGAALAVSGVSGVSAALENLLSALGGDAAPENGTNSDTATADADAGSTAAGNAASPALAQLADKLEALSSTLAQTQPSLSGDLDHLAGQLQQLPAGSTGGTQQATGPAMTATPAPAGGLASTGAAAGSVSGQLAAVAPQGSAPQPAGTKSTGTTKHDHAAVEAASSQPADGETAPDKADIGKATGGDGKTDATAGTPPANAAAGTTSAAQSATADAGAAPNAAITLTSAQPMAGPAASAAQQAQAAYQAADTATINLPQMAFEIARHVQHGSSEFQIRLDPADLGRVDVTLAVDATGNVSAHLAVERADTLALLRQDAGSLNQALAQAGLAGGKANLQFSLSQNPFTRQENGGQPTTPAPASTDNDQSPAPIQVAPAITRYRGSLASSNLNIFV